jgi:hypothetical protein
MINIVCRVCGPLLFSCLFDIKEDLVVGITDLCWCTKQYFKTMGKIQHVTVPIKYNDEENYDYYDR